MKGFPSVLENINDLNLKQIQALLSLTKDYKTKDSDLVESFYEGFRTPIVATSFLENSTRTKHSFAIAIQKLGGMYIDFNADTSSLKKGETLEETLLTLRHQGVDCCIIRTSVSHELSQFQENPPLKIVNGGDGNNQHPTQALLDLFTMQENHGSLKGKTMAIIGDCVHSRVTHSLIELLPQLGMKLILCGPAGYIPDSVDNENISLCSDRDEAIAQSDFLYLLRIQKERHSGGEDKHFATYHEKYGCSLDVLGKFDKELFVYHPGPANIGVEISMDLIKSPLYQGYKQVENSTYMRMAIMACILSNRNISCQLELNGDDARINKGSSGL